MPVPTSESGARRPLERGLLTNALGIVVKASRALYLILFSRILGAEGFGTYLLAFAVQEFVSKFAILGLNWGGKQVTGALLADGRESAVRATVVRILSIALLSSSLVAIGLVLGAEGVATVLGQATIAQPLRIFAAGFPFLCGMYVLVYSFRPKLNMKFELWVTSIVEPLGVLLIGFLLLQLNTQVRMLAWAHVCASAIAFATALYLFNRLYPPSREGRPPGIDWKMLVHGSAGMGAMEMVINLQTSIDLFILATFFPPQVIGVYGAAVQIVALLRKSKAAFDPILMPITQGLYLQKQPQRLQAEVSRAVGWALLIGLGMLGLMVLLPDQLLGLFGREFAGAGFGVILIILAFGQVFNMSLGLSEGILAITGHAYVSLVSGVALVITEIIGLYLLIPVWGLPGAALAASLPFVGVTVWRAAQTRRLLGIRMFGPAQLRILLTWLACLAPAVLLLWAQPGASTLTAVVIAAGFAAAYTLMARRGRLPRDAAGARTD